MFGLPQCLAIVAVAVWAVMPILVKHAAFESNISLFLVVRFTLSTILLAAVMGGIVRKLSAQKPIEWLAFLLLNGVIYFLQTIALQALPATLYIVVFSLTPILCLITLRIRLNSWGWLCVGITLVSCIWFAQSGKHDTSSSLSWTAMLAMLGGMVSWAIYSAFIIRFQTTFSDVEIAGLSSVFGLMAALPIWAFSGFSTAGVSGLHLGGAALIGLIVPIGYYAYSYALRKTPVFAVTSQYFEPILALVVAVALTSETITPQQAVAALICIAAAVMAERVGKQHAAG
ncbi:DMT family transporter [Chitinimonas sp. PSY-7]|uniref:EamA family transporter n=1 Tax=Chitinimonas sp. PSY-7 TaxID=3459088 RepID=UPI0040403BF0